MRSVSIVASLFGVVFLALGSGLLAQSATPFPGAAPFTASSAELRRASAAVPVAKEFEAQILFEEGTYRIAADGTLRYEHRLIYRVDAEDAVKGWSEVSSEWDPWYEKPAQLHARVLQASGAFAVLDQKTVTDAPVKAEDSETFSSQHERRAPLPGVAVGAIVEETETTEETIPYFAQGSLYRFYFRRNMPTAHTRLIVELPSSMPFKDAIHGLPTLAVDRTESNGVRRVVYDAMNLPASHDYDIDLATNTPTSPLVEFATGASWAAVAAGYAGLADPQTIPADVQSLLPKDLPSGRLDRIRALVKILHREVRYTGVEFGSARLTPERPAEVLKRHYGDCKEKATFLVAMLRSAGIPANLALLSTGVGRDVDPALPGMNQFDHAIVYVPAGTNPGEDALWIDATAEYFSVGSIPYDDEGRNALIVAANTTSLTRTPDPKPEDSILIETRTFHLAETGPAQVEEVSETHGFIDASYRSDYGGAETPKIREQMENYVKSAYLAKKLVKIEHGDAADLDHPFKLTLAADGAKRGFTSLVDAAVAIFPTVTIGSLPKWFSTEPPAVGPDTSAAVRHELELSVASRPVSFAVRPYIYEVRNRILVPPGFELRALPPARTTPIGPAALTETYSSEPGVVLATFRFSSGPSTLTAEQALAMRDAILELNKRDYVGVFFDQSGAKALTAGHIREALEIDRKLIAANPSSAFAHLHLSRALLDAGIGSEAQAEARRAIELDPKSSVAFQNLGWTLQHNALGERFGNGYDRAAAISAYKRSIELDPEDNDPRFDLAILYEFNARGVRYAPDADVANAISAYKALIDLNKDKGEDAIAQYRDNMLYSLLYTHQFSELDKLLATLPANSGHRTLAISSAAAQHGAAAGIAQADKGNAAGDRNKNLRSAGTQLAGLHLYKEAADIISAGIAGDTEAATAARQVELYRSLKVASLAPLPATDPASPVQSAYIGLMSGSLTHDRIVAVMSRHAYSSPSSLELDAKRALESVGFMRRVAKKSEMGESVLLDLIAGNTTFGATGDDEKGWSVVARVPGSKPQHTYVVKEDGVYRIVADETDNAAANDSIGNEVLYLLSQNRPAAAKALLDWKRDLTHKGGGDDPFAGALLPRFWTIDSAKPGANSPEAMRLAALSLLAVSMDAKPYLSDIAAARDKATGSRQTDLDLLLAVAAIHAEQPELGLPAAERLLDQEPDSEVALSLIGEGFSLRNDPAGWQAVLTPRLAKKPADHDLLVQQARVYELAHDWKAAKIARQEVLDTGKATASDYNSFAWLGLFHDDLGDDITKAAQQSVQMEKNSSFASLHTLACIDAAQGKITEARQVLDQAMYARNLGEPSSEVWFALGLIYEQYGADSAALEAYRKVEAHPLDDHTYIGPTATYVLAQARIGDLAAKVVAGRPALPLAN